MRLPTLIAIQAPNRVEATRAKRRSQAVFLRGGSGTVRAHPQRRGMLARSVPDSPSLHCLVEIPKGSRNKYEWDPDLGAIVLDRFLFSSVVYPTDYGFIPETLGEDGDPLDAMIIVSEPTFPGCVIRVKPIALFKMRDDKGEDDKVLCVPLHDPNWNTLEKLEDLPIAFRDEISHFFSMYKEPEGKVVKVDGWFPLDYALRTIETAREAWRAGQK